MRTNSSLSGSEALWLGVPTSPHPPVVTAVLELSALPSPERLLALPFEAAALPAFSHVPVRRFGRWVWRPLRVPPALRLHDRDVFDLLLSSPLPPSSPWELHLLPPLQDGGPRLVLRAHHALGDGATLVSSLLELVGSRERPKVLPRRRFEFLLAPFAAFSLLSYREPRSASPPPSGKRSASLGPYDLEALLHAARSRSVTLNELLLAALGRVCEQMGARGLHAAAPVSRRRRHAPGNDFGLVLLPLPAGSLPARLRAARRTSRRLRRSGQPSLLSFLVSLSGSPLLGRLLRPLALWLLSRRASLVFSNVVGPSAPASLAGVELRSLSFSAPQVGDLPLSLGVVSYAGMLTFGLVADDTFALPRFVSLLEGELSALL